MESTTLWVRNALFFKIFCIPKDSVYVVSQKKKLLYIFLCIFLFFDQTQFVKVFTLLSVLRCLQNVDGGHICHHF